MDIINDSHISIHLVLRRLIKEKSQRDNVKFTAFQLAQALGIPRSIITKLTHTDKTKRVINPRIDTLLKIVGFFRADGFNITLEDLLGLEKKSIAVRDQTVPKKLKPITVPIYHLNRIDEKIGHIDISLTGHYQKVVGLLSDKNIKPFFKSGSIFIIDTVAKLENEVLVALKLSDNNETQIKKYCIYDNKVVLKSLESKESDIVLLPTSSIIIIGVVVQVNAKT